MEDRSAAAAGSSIAKPMDPVEQWLHWEEQANLVGFRTSTDVVRVAVAAVPRVELAVHIAAGAPEGILAGFLRGETVLYPRHPLNADAHVAYTDAPAACHWPARFTSSRTLVVVDGRPGDPLFSVKLPTDHPHPDFHQPEKTKLREEAVDAVLFADLVARVDRLIGRDPALLLIREVLVAMVPGAESGFMVRDLRPLQDGHFYLPALSLPFAGREIAARHGADFAAFWGEAYAEAAGRAKALLLARYGLQFETPNPQNLLVQLDRTLRPTGTVVFRDLGDAILAADARTTVERPWSRLEAAIRPESANSFWAFEGDHPESVPSPTIADWIARHDRAYRDTLGGFFGVDGRAGADSTDDPWAGLTGQLASPAGRRAVEATFERLRTARPPAGAEG